MVVQSEQLMLIHALIALRAWSHWYYVVSMNPKYLPGFRILQTGFETALKSLCSENRRTVIRLIVHRRCLFCGTNVGLGQGDHLIPLSEGYYHSVENYAPLCKRCNSSKGTKDLLEWWVEKEKHITELHPDALTVYLRLKFRFSSPDELYSPASEYFIVALQQAEATIPTNLLWFWRKKLKEMVMNTMDSELLRGEVKL
jgi:hypothetical protein